MRGPHSRPYYSIRFGQEESEHVSVHGDRLVFEDAYVDGAMLVITVHPVEGQRGRLFQMVLYADAPFAACR